MSLKECVSIDNLLLVVNQVLDSIPLRKSQPIIARNFASSKSESMVRIITFNFVLQLVEFLNKVGQSKTKVKPVAPWQFIISARVWTHTMSEMVSVITKEPITFSSFLEALVMCKTHIQIHMSGLDEKESNLRSKFGG